MTGFDTLLVANRGEIAARIIRTARRLGLRTVAVYSDPDRPAPHVRLADQAVRLGPAPAKASYLDVDAVLEAARSTGAGAIHPGYGFLSEDADFARRCEAAGLVFVGPTPHQLELFGAKHTARAAAEAAGVPLLPGTGLLPGLEAATTAATALGYPVMLKATGGGGGIGMQACHSPADLAEAWERVQRVAAASFSSAGVFLERLVEHARHVEVQVFGDGHGRVLTLGDRDCSLQRRNQKVLEEAPAPGLPDSVRAQLADTARALCASVGYRSAGTVEYVYDAAREQAYFLEVNTRLQVEHPVTEETYGVDLVEWMLRLARGEAFEPTPPAPRGHAVEARIYAEDPTRGHRPSAGVLTQVVFPPDVRVDAWIETGTEVTTSYDPMLAKVIVHGADRADALDRLARALDGTRIDGIETNLGLLRAAAAEPALRSAAHTTATLTSVTDPTPASRSSAPAPSPPSRTGPAAPACGMSAYRPAAPWTTCPSASATRPWAIPRAPPGSNAPSRARSCASPTPPPSASPARRPPSRWTARACRNGSRSPSPPEPSWTSRPRRNTACARTFSSRAASTSPPSSAAPPPSPSAASAGTVGAPCARGTCCTAACRPRPACAYRPTAAPPSPPSG